jgi:hypothetical protein
VNPTVNLQSAPFPGRPVALRAPGIGLFSQLGGIVWALVIFGGTLLVVLPPGLDLAGDLGIRSAARPVRGGRVEGRCRVRALLADCEVELVAPPFRGAPEVRRKVDYLFFATPGVADYRAVVMADPAQPGRLTTDLGLDRLWNRLVTLLVVGPFLLAIGLAALLMAPGEARRKRRLARALSGKQLRLGLLRLERWSRGEWTVVPYPAGAPGERTVWNAPGFPAVLDPAQGLVLAVTTGDGSASMPLDGGLSFVDLTPEERRRLVDWIGPERLAWRPPQAVSRMDRLRRGAPAMLMVGLVLAALAGLFAFLAFGDSGANPSFDAELLGFVVCGGVALGLLPVSIIAFARGRRG